MKCKDVEELRRLRETVRHLSLRIMRTEDELLKVSRELDYEMSKQCSTWFRESAESSAISFIAN